MSRNATRIINDRSGREPDYAAQADRDFALWKMLEQAGLLPPPDRLPSRALIRRAQKILAEQQCAALTSD
ncbi:MAG: hypothetical protein ACUVRU_13105 [Anaerolineae bacterium]